MKSTTKASALIKDAISEIEIATMGPVKSYVSSETLEQFRIQLETMLRNIEKNTLPPKTERMTGMGLVIVDSWPFGTSLGNAVLAAEQAYCSL